MTDPSSMSYVWEIQYKIVGGCSSHCRPKVHLKMKNEVTDMICKSQTPFQSHGNCMVHEIKGDSHLTSTAPRGTWFGQLYIRQSRKILNTIEIEGGHKTTFTQRELGHVMRCEGFPTNIPEDRSGGSEWHWEVPYRSIASVFRSPRYLDIVLDQVPQK
jgi:hypothetical protein